MVGKVVTSAQVNLAKVDVFKFELSIAKMFLFALVGTSHFNPNSAFSFPRQQEDNQVNLDTTLSRSKT